MKVLVTVIRSNNTKPIFVCLVNHFPKMHFLKTEEVLEKLRRFIFIYLFATSATHCQTSILFYIQCLSDLPLLTPSPHCFFPASNPKPAFPGNPQATPAQETCRLTVDLHPSLGASKSKSPLSLVLSQLCSRAPAASSHQPQWILPGAFRSLRPKRQVG